MRQALELALESLLHAYHEDEAHPKTLEAITAIKEALAQPEQRAQLLFEVDGEMLTASQMMGIELFNFQQATGCDTAAEFLAQPEQEPVAFLTNKRQRLNIELKPQTFVEIPTVTDWEMPLYMKPPQRIWVGLTDEEIKQGESKEEQGYGFIQGALWAEATLKEKNHG